MHNENLKIIPILSLAIKTVSTYIQNCYKKTLKITFNIDTFDI